MSSLQSRKTKPLQGRGQEHQGEHTPRSDFDPSSESAGDNVQHEQEDFKGLR